VSHTTHFRGLCAGEMGNGSVAVISFCSLTIVILNKTFWLCSPVQKRERNENIYLTMIGQLLAKTGIHIKACCRFLIFYTIFQKQTQIVNE
jgi:hypothetical protein